MVGPAKGEQKMGIDSDIITGNPIIEALGVDPHEILAHDSDEVDVLIVVDGRTAFAGELCEVADMLRAHSRVVFSPRRAGRRA